MEKTKGKSLLKDIVDNKCKMASLMGDFDIKSRQLVEECGEYIQAWCKLKRDDMKPDAFNDYISELSDVLCVAMQLANQVGEEAVYKEINRKLDRYFTREAECHPERVKIEPYEGEPKTE